MCYMLHALLHWMNAVHCKMSDILPHNGLQGAIDTLWPGSRALLFERHSLYVPINTDSSMPAVWVTVFTSCMYKA
jgi:hypothetical protein